MSTRDQFIATAEHLFAARGFYGVSIAAIAEQMGLTKQALLHYFSSKEKLYGEVLQAISGELLAVTREIIEREADPASRLTELVVAHLHKLLQNPDAARLIMRELLDNEQRAGSAASWYLQPYLETLVDTALMLDPARVEDRGQALAMIYQLLGAAHYFAISGPTLSRMFGPDTYAEAAARCEQELRQLIRARLAGER
ncbi:TetR family transcriptional regulator [Seongchinamella sediminis]|uniref:TetR family transcriptional regulator n=1 Tax=Seongchinamella sediminis TaxID=2283635 RepID=A0A3L7E4S8_9GAMM|nr:TetR/AcrR family transcriptional regulator [Seongchinamella sediminis]RLQ23561.1 TetR family transcriptional regulator [Seongchinamella sediminis]